VLGTGDAGHRTEWVRGRIANLLPRARRRAGIEPGPLAPEVRRRAPNHAPKPLVPHRNCDGQSGEALRVRTGIHEARANLRIRSITEAA
jgi:hypothetical protein